MKTLVLAASVILATPLDAAETYIGAGYSYRADYSGRNLYSLTIQDKDWKYFISSWESYHRSPWDVNTHPTWGAVEIPKHEVLSITNTIYSYDFTDDFTFFFDFGVSYTNEVNRVTSSHLLFRENIGIDYKNIRLIITHDSNAGIKGDNTGEDAIMLQWRIL